MKKRIMWISSLTAFCFLLASCAGPAGNKAPQGSLASLGGGNAKTAKEQLEPLHWDGWFSDGDYRNVSDERPNAEISLEDNEGVISDTTRGSSGSTVTVTSKGIYHISGSAEDVTIVVNDTKKSGNVYLILDGVEMRNVQKPCIFIETADKVILQCVGENRLEFSAAEEKTDGAIYAGSDVTINGSGSLCIESALHGIVCKKDLRVTGEELELEIEAGRIGIKSEKSVCFDGADSSIRSGHDGIQISIEGGEGYFVQKSGKVRLTAGYDGIDVKKEKAEAKSRIVLAGGEMDVVSGGGADCSRNAKQSQKGLKCDGEIWLMDGKFRISSADDALYANGNAEIAGGITDLFSGDDGVRVGKLLLITGGYLHVGKAYEGFEAGEVCVSGGESRITASDDGINVAGGNDARADSETEERTAGSSGFVMSGGKVYVDAQGDGVDSNGSIFVSGGLLIVEGPENSLNAALDKGDGTDCRAEITGGTVLAIGSDGMAKNFDSGSQCSGLAVISGDAGDRIDVEDGSGFTYCATKSFSCVVYSAPTLKEGEKYQITAGNHQTVLDFTSGRYFSDLTEKNKGN
ncbi:MAG: carbohydrate-binding domain-containing protein [Lachnospiraceae bacterium]|nr:carbohydrate-binding domain-containing protein [Lachnospiraceae bacterium]